MANSSTILADLKSGRCSSTVEVRLLRFWEARNVNRGGELVGVNMILLDAKATLIPATINVHRLPTFRGQLKAGSMFSLRGFDVTRCNPNLRLSVSPQLIRFSDATRFDELTEPITPIPDEHFIFRNHSDLLGLANSNTQIPDIIGEITTIKSTISDPAQEKDRMMVTIKMDNNVSVTLNMFESQAVSFHSQLDSFKVDPRVVVATSINPKMVGGYVFLNATSGTQIYFDKETNAGEAFFNRLVSEDTGNTSAASWIRGSTKFEPITIAELNEFILTAQPQVAQ